MDSLKQYKVLHLEVVDNANVAAPVVLSTYRVEVVRPPVLFVSGLSSSDPKEFEWVNFRLIDFEQMYTDNQILDGACPGNKSLAANAQNFINKKAELLNLCKAGNISAQKIFQYEF